MGTADRPFVPRPSRASARNGLNGDGGTKGRDGSPHDEQPPPATEEMNAYKADDPEKLIVIILADEFRLPEMLRHIEAGRIVCVILPEPRPASD